MKFVQVQDLNVFPFFGASRRTWSVVVTVDIVLEQVDEPCVALTAIQVDDSHSIAGYVTQLCCLVVCYLVQ